MSPTFHRKYKYFYPTVQTAEGRRQKFIFSFAVSSCLISLFLNAKLRVGVLSAKQARKKGRSLD